MSTTLSAFHPTTRARALVVRATALLLLCGFAFAATCPAQWQPQRRRAKRSSRWSSYRAARTAPAAAAAGVAAAAATASAAEPASSNPEQATPGESASFAAPVVKDTQAAPSASPASEAAPSDVRPMSDSDRLTFMNDTSGAATPEAPGTGGLLLRTLGALILIVGLIAGVGFALRRFGGARFGSATEDAPALAVLNSVALGDRRSIAVVRYGARTLLIGSTQQAITLLADSDQDLDAEALTQPGARSVADMLEHDDDPLALHSAPSFSRAMTQADSRFAVSAGSIPQASDYRGGRA